MNLPGSAGRFGGARHVCWRRSWGSWRREEDSCPLPFWNESGIGWLVKGNVYCSVLQWGLKHVPLKYRAIAQWPQELYHQKRLVTNTSGDSKLIRQLLSSGSVCMDQSLFSGTSQSAEGFPRDPQLESSLLTFSRCLADGNILSEMELNQKCRTDSGLITLDRPNVVSLLHSDASDSH